MISSLFISMASCTRQLTILRITDVTHNSKNNSFLLGRLCLIMIHLWRKLGGTPTGPAVVTTNYGVERDISTQDWDSYSSAPS